MRKALLPILFLILIFGLSAQVKFQLEFDGGYSFASSETLSKAQSLYVGFLEEFVKAAKEAEAAGSISNLKIEEEGEFKTAKNLLSMGGRFKVLIAENFGISLGVNYLTRNVSGTPAERLDFVMGGIAQTEKVEMLKQNMKADVFMPEVALHLIMPGEVVGFEVWGGVGYANVNVESDAHLKWRHEESGFWQELQVHDIYKGSAKGIAFDFGGRINLWFAENVGLFIGGGYILAKFKELKGEGSYEKKEEDSTGWSSTDSRSWTNETWYLATVDLLGRKKVEFATNDPNYATDKTGEFELNLSNFRVLVGFFFTF